MLSGLPVMQVPLGPKHRPSQLVSPSKKQRGGVSSRSRGHEEKLGMVQIFRMRPANSATGFVLYIYIIHKIYYLMFLDYYFNKRSQTFYLLIS